VPFSHPSRYAVGRQPFFSAYLQGQALTVCHPFVIEPLLSPMAALDTGWTGGRVVKGSRL
jgi:hypothetical protein